MGLAVLGSFVFLSLFFGVLTSQEPNTDGFFIEDFFKKMGVAENSSAPVCSWKGVLCNATNLDIISLTATGRGLSGIIPENTIGKLSKLQHLDLSNNNITGLSSDFWGLGSTLKSLNLSHNRISGPLESNIGNFALLESLSLSNNSFEGSIPSGLLNCKALVSIDLSYNSLNETVPDGFGSAFANLSALNLARNEIPGRLSDFSGLKYITSLNLSGNLFQGPLVDVFEMPLKVLDLSQNQFQGHFSQEFPSHIGNLLGVEYLNLSKTGLVGPIPSNISQLSSLKTLDLSQNHLTGHVPNLSGVNLQVLDLSRNNLTGEIPLQLVHKLLEMVKFNFSYNNLSLCAAEFKPEIWKTAFIGSQNSCPIATNPDLFRTRGKKHKGLKLSLAIVLSVVSFLIGMLCLVFGCRRKTRMWAVKQLSYKEEQNISGPFSFQTDSTTWVADVKLATSVPVILFDKPLLNFTFADLLSATSHFDRGTLLAEGRFGPVYRGLLPGGIHVAVKVLVYGSTIPDQEAARGLEHLGRIKHPNLVPLIGYCLAGDQRIAIYEYMENGNLQNLLHDLPLGVQKTEDWSTDTWEEDGDGIQNIASEGVTTWVFRYKIALGAARALAFLHHGCFPQIIHRDVKASSIYLGLEMDARISDFGLAKIVGTSLEDWRSRGSPGYMPPEFSQPETAHATSKSDVYGFGVVLFELITGKKPIGDDYPEEKDSNLVNWVRGIIRKNEGSRAIDPKIRGTGSEAQMVEALRIGYLCTADSPSKRPSMQQIVGLLKDIEPVASQ
ncbi:Protein kinase domain-containing protein [Cinnamomum micranthum f. kanehirae]|uniref:Protein kinase domain-containing protein n=1 Tax=Cinnamomum micranthum f. kanehirae TaxID=337451 RepID=A0A443PK46_9MAGN|nr:Protein kinase domain-containing protein [Cinnamomum micranthum f. kanehirae]